MSADKNKEREKHTQPDTPACEIALRTDPGRDPDKQVNEDSAAHVETSLGLLAIVCDGMGGHAGGKEASELAVKTIIEMVQQAPPGSAHGDVLRGALSEANHRIWNMPTAEAGLRPGSTVVAMLLHEGGASIAHVGDSRIYLVHAGAISQVTRDHSMVQELVDRNLIKAEDAAKHPDANKILRALGIAKDVDVDVRPEPVAYVAGDVFIMCSDGLSDLVTPAEILELAGDSPKQAAGRLVDLANARGGHDNITALVLRTKTSARSDTAPILMKTMPLTAHAPPVKPAETVLEAPLGVAPPPGAAPAPIGSGPTLESPVHPGQGGTQKSPQVTVVAPRAGAAIPPAPEPPHSERGPSRAPIAIALALAVIALAVLGLFYLNRREHRNTVPIVNEPPKDSGVQLVDDDNDPNTPPVIVSVAPLAPPPSATQRKWDGVRSPDPCIGAGRARANGAPQNVIDRLEAACRADGGTPIPYVPPPTLPAPTPTPIATPKPQPTQ